VVVQRDGPRFLLHLNSLSAAHALPELPRTVRTWLMGEWLARNGMMERPEVFFIMRSRHAASDCPLPVVYLLLILSYEGGNV
jgi:hypothetical protein